MRHSIASTLTASYRDQQQQQQQAQQQRAHRITMMFYTSGYQ